MPPPDPTYMPVTSATPGPVAPTAVPGVAGATGGLASAGTGGWEPPPPPTPTVNIPPNLAGAGQISPAMPGPPPQQPAPTAGQDMGLPPAYQGPAQRGGAVKNALTRMLYGMGQAGLQHVGLPTDYDIQKQQYDQALRANDLALKQQAQQFGQQMVDTPMGPMPQQTWQKIGGSFLAAQARVQGADITAQGGIQREQIAKHYIPTPQGILDTWSGTFKPGTQLGATVDDDLISEYPVLAPYKGQVLKPADLMRAYSVTMQGLPVTRSSTDPLGLTTTTVTKKETPGVPSTTAAPTASTAPPAATAPPTGGGTVVPPRRTAGTGLPSGATPPPAIPSAGNPLDDAAIRLVEGDTDPSQIPKRGAANLVIQQKANAYSMAKYGKPFDQAQASIDYNYARQTSTQNTLKYLNSLTGPDNKSGNLQTLVNLSNSPGVARTQWPPVNDVQAWVRLKSGSGPQAAYAATILEVADQVGKILQGGSQGTSDKKLNEAQSLFQKGFNTDQIRDVATSLRDLLGNRKNELIGNNRYLLRQFGQGGGQQGGTSGGNRPPLTSFEHK